ncbi:MAG: dihydrofolate reductase [Anaerolineaceae bacterium]|nr:dihydrofolate reductase [Anaerolineaceae bacterium]
MKKIKMLNRVSLDGYYAGPNGEIDWFIHDPEVDKASHEMMQADTVLFGRSTYQMFAAYWPLVGQDPTASENDRSLSLELDRMTKVVFSNTLDGVTWMNSRLVKGDVTPITQALKREAGTDITVFGSGSLVQQLTNAGLIDEYLFIVTPVILGAGKSLFDRVSRRDLNLIETRHFASGNILIHYKQIGRA